MSSVDIKAEKEEIERLMQALVQADNDKDVDLMMSFNDADVIAHMPFMPEVRGLEANREMAEKSMTETGFWIFNINKIDITSNAEMAYLTGTYHFTVKDWKADSYYAESDMDKEIVDDGKMLVVWRKSGEGWKVVAYSSSSDLPSK